MFVPINPFRLCLPNAFGPTGAASLIFLSALLHHFHGQNCSDSKTITKESVFADASWWAQIPGFRRFEPMPSDLSYAIESRRFDVGRLLVSSADTHHQVDSRL